MRRLFVVVTILLLLGTSSAFAPLTSHQPLQQMLTLDDVRYIHGLRLGGAYDYFDQCSAKPWRCEGHPEASVKLDRYRWQELVLVNTLVNLQIRYESELPGEDIWQDDVSITAGDCEDYALVKRRLLVAKGWPAGALSIAIGRASKHDRVLHAVLIARTDKGDFVLNNQHDEVGLWNTVHFYHWYLREASDVSAQWYRIETLSPAKAVGSR